jgi:hypothetical protein
MVCLSGGRLPPSQSHRIVWSNGSRRKSSNHGYVCMTDLDPANNINEFIKQAKNGKPETEKPA